MLRMRRLTFLASARATAVHRPASLVGFHPVEEELCDANTGLAKTFPVILTPLSVKRTPATRADLVGDASVRSLFWNNLRFMSSINVLGLPAAVVPAGLVSGNPVGVQLIGSRYREDLCLDAAAAIEAKVGIMAKRLWERS